MSTRNTRPFVHLRVLSHYSLGLGLSSPADVCRHARRVGFDTVALTDVSGTYGFAEFHRAARECGVKPVYGTLLFLDWTGTGAGAGSDPAQSIILLALDRTGLRNVCAAASQSAIRRESGEAFSASDLDGLSDGVVAITGIDVRGSGLAPRHLLAPLREIFGDRLFLECAAGLPEARAASQAMAMADAEALGVERVLVQDVRFVGPSRPQLIDLLGSLGERAYEHRVFSDPRAGDAGAAHGMMTASEMSQAYETFPDACTNTALIASLVQPDLLDALEEARETPAVVEMFDPGAEHRATLERRVEHAIERAAMDDAAREAARRRCAHELSLIAQAGLEDAFVHFGELARRLREAGVRLGPATGLSLQSLCAHLLRITAFDPYDADPGFEPGFAAGARPGRIFDLQVPPQDRPAVLTIINRAFEGASVGYVPTVEHITAARAIRIVARRQGLVPADYEDAVRAATRRHGASLRDLSEEDATFGTLYRRSAAFRDVVAHAAAIEGLPFGFARTKRTVIVSPRPLRAFFAHTVSPDSGEHFVQATRESFPLGAIIRIDISTLNLLGVLAPGERVSLDDDASLYALVDADDLEGIHLLESTPGRLARAFGIASFEDLVQFVALLRHRGSGLTLPARLAAFREKPRAYPVADRLEPVLGPTRGWMLFDDQLRDAMAALTGLDRAGAAALVARLADPSPGNLAALRREYLSRTVEQSISFEDATHWFARMVRESRYTVDRQSVIAECLLVRHCLRRKQSDRLAFMARLLDLAGDDRRARYREALEREGRYLAPRVGRSGRGHRVEGTGVRAPLWMVPGITRETADRIMRMGPATDAQEIICAAKEAGISLEQIDALERAGAIDVSAGPAAASREGALPEAGGIPTRPDVSPPAGPAEGRTAPAVSPQMYPPVPATSINKDGNPRSGFRVLPTVLEFYPHPYASPVELAGRIRNLQSFKSSSGQKVGFFELFDSSGSVRVFIPWERVVQGGEPLGDGSRVVVRGKVRQREGRKVCDALEIVVTEGGNGRGETSPDNPPEGDT